MDARNNRQAVMAEFGREQSSSYHLFASKRDGGKVLVARVEDGKTVVQDKKRFERLLKDPTADVARLAATRIDGREIDRVSQGYSGEFREQVRMALKRYEGKSWQEAISAHGSTGSGGP